MGKETRMVKAEDGKYHCQTPFGDFVWPSALSLRESSGPIGEHCVVFDFTDGEAAQFQTKYLAKYGTLPMGKKVFKEAILHALGLSMTPITKTRADIQMGQPAQVTADTIAADPVHTWIIDQVDNHKRPAVDVINDLVTSGHQIETLKKYFPSLRQPTQAPAPAPIAVPQPPTTTMTAGNDFFL